MRPISIGPSLLKNRLASTRFAGDCMDANIALVQRHRALSGLRDRRLLRELAYVDGRWRSGASGEGFAVADPATGDPIAWVTSLSRDEAARAFTEWRALLPQQRASILRRWFDLILSSKDDLALLITLERGKPLTESRGEVEYAGSFVEWYAEEAKRIRAESAVNHLKGAELIVRREPLGVVALATPWNFPSAMLTRKAAAALAAGCTIVAYPSSETPLSALALAELGERAGLPPGAFNVITGDAATIVGRLCEDVRVRAMSFTGSSEIGRLIAARCASTMKRLVLELGGHAPLIIFDDAKLGRAVDIALAAKFATSGQDCLAANRIYVQRALYDSFCQAYSERIAALNVGSGLDVGVDVGPLIHARAIAKVEMQIADALTKGARLLVGGRRHPAGELFLQPTLLVDTPDAALIMRRKRSVQSLLFPRSILRKRLSLAPTPPNTALSPMS